VPTVDDPTEVQYEESRAYRWTVRTLYLTLLAANVYLVFDWWKDTPEGQAMLARAKARIDALKVKAQECEGCAKRKAMLQAAINRMQWDAERIVEGTDDVQTEPEQ
jgi:hypothetical protein